MRHFKYIYDAPSLAPEPGEGLRRPIGAVFLSLAFFVAYYLHRLASEAFSRLARHAGATGSTLALVAALHFAAWRPARLPRMSARLQGAAGVAAALLCARAAGAEALTTPIPFDYTDYSQPSVTDQDHYWRRFFSAEAEARPAVGGEAFVAHLSIGRPGVKQSFGVLYSARLCRDLRADGPITLSKCPSKLATFFDDGRPARVEEIEQDVCIVRAAAHPPPLGQAGWNAAQATFRDDANGPFMILSAVVQGELVSECTLRIPLGPIK